MCVKRVMSKLFFRARFVPLHVHVFVFLTELFDYDAH